MADTGPEAARRLLSTVRAAAGRILERGGFGQNASVGHVDPPQLGEGWGGKVPSVPPFLSTGSGRN